MHDRAPGAKRAAAPSSNSLGKGAAPEVNARLMVSNLHYEITPVDLSKIFGQTGVLVREPQIRYDRSGRSSGVAFVTYENAEQAAKAKATFDNKTAKGQAMTIEFAAPPPGSRRAVSAQATKTLLNRIEKPSLIERISQDDIALVQPKANNRAKPARTEGGAGPVRNKRGANKPQPKQRKKPMTAEDLDRELEAFMDEPVAKSGEKAGEGPQADAGKSTEAAKPAEDVEMA